MNAYNYSVFLLLKLLLYEVLITIKRVQKKYKDIIINDLIPMKESVNINLFCSFKRIFKNTRYFYLRNIFSK